MVHWFSAVHQDDQSSFTPNKVDQELEKSIDGEGLVWSEVSIHGIIIYFDQYKPRRYRG